MTPFLEKARRYAKTAHAGQTYGDEFPYIVHLQSAYSVATRFGITDEEVLAAVWLHDSVEDTGRTFEELATLFNQRVADIVAVVTEPSEVDGRVLTRKERHEISYKNIRHSSDGRLVKLCDRISHVEFGGKKVSMYRKEHPSFKAAIKNIPETTLIEEKMWEYLDTLISEIP